VAAVLGVCLGVRGVSAVAAETPSAESVGDVVVRVQARFDAAADLRGDVVQEVFVAALDRVVSASGTVVFKRPGKMRWNLTGDEPQIIVADGETVWFYQPADEQVLRAPLASVFRSSTPVSFLTGVGKISEDFDVGLQSRDAERITLSLDPKRRNGDVGRLRLVVAARSAEILEARVTDPVGNVTTLKFSNLERNTGVADEEFAFVVPPGVDVVEAPIGY
jgi:outer membrane lipoprotein carrier protein